MVALFDLEICAVVFAGMIRCPIMGVIFLGLVESLVRRTFSRVPVKVDIFAGVSASGHFRGCSQLVVYRGARGCIFFVLCTYLAISPLFLSI